MTVISGIVRVLVVVLAARACASEISPHQQAAQTGAARPTPDGPILSSKVPAIQMTVVGEDRVFVKLALRNLSDRMVTAVVISTPQAGGGGERLADNPHGVIAAGESLEMEAQCSNGGKLTEHGFEPDTAPCRMILEAALFADGSYAGEPAYAANMLARRMGEKVQRGRVNQVIGRIVADAEIDEAGKLARIRSEVSQLSEDPDPAMIAELREQFPDLSEREWLRVQGEIHSGLNLGKQSAVFQVTDFERLQRDLQRDGQPRLSLTEWWKRQQQAIK